MARDESRDPFNELWSEIVSPLNNHKSSPAPKSHHFSLNLFNGFKMGRQTARSHSYSVKPEGEGLSSCLMFRENDALLTVQSVDKTKLSRNIF